MRTLWVAVASLIVSATGAQAQYIWVDHGSTAEGDYLRGVGIAAYGLGVLTEKTANANQIEANTWMRVNDYLWNVAKNENLENAIHRAEKVRRQNDEHKARLARVRDNPEAIDVMNGSALNAKLQELLDPQVPESALRSMSVPLDADIVRTIPFKLGDKGLTFSMHRLALNGKNKWVEALREKEFDSLRRAYERAVDQALELAIEQKPNTAIDAIIKAVDDLDRKVRTTPRLDDPAFKRMAGEARTQVDQLMKTKELFQTHKIRDVLLDIDLYHGTTVAEFRQFMRKHNLTFAPTDSGDEREIYVQLYSALLEQRDKVIDRDRASKR